MGTDLPARHRHRASRRRRSRSGRSRRSCIRAADGAGMPHCRRHGSGRPARHRLGTGSERPRRPGAAEGGPEHGERPRLLELGSEHIGQGPPGLGERRRCAVLQPGQSGPEVVAVRVRGHRQAQEGLGLEEQPSRSARRAISAASRTGWWRRNSSLYSRLELIELGLPPAELGGAGRLALAGPPARPAGRGRRRRPDRPR